MCVCVCVYVNSITVIRYSDVDGVGGVAAIVFSTPPLPPIIFSSTIFLSPGSYFIQELEQIRQVWRRLFILSPSCAEPGFSEILWDSLRYWDRGGGGAAILPGLLKYDSLRSSRILWIFGFCFSASFVSDSLEILSRCHKILPSFDFFVVIAVYFLLPFFCLIESLMNIGINPASNLRETS